MSYKDKKVWIVGASSGIGRALSVELAARGAKIALSARSKESLDALREVLGEDHLSVPLDVGNDVSVIAAYEQIEKTWGRVDSVFFMSAVYKPSSVALLNLDDVKETLNINLMGAFRLISVALPAMRKAGAGHIVLCGSVAGYRGLPNGQPYSATKAALINLAETLKIEEEKNGIDVRLINPGFVKTSMTDKNNFEMPMIIMPEQAAKEIADQLLTAAFEIHFPKKFTFIMKFLRILPAWAYFLFAKKI